MPVRRLLWPLHLMQVRFREGPRADRRGFLHNMWCRDRRIRFSLNVRVHLRPGYPYTTRQKMIPLVKLRVLRSLHLRLEWN